MFMLALLLATMVMTATSAEVLVAERTAEAVLDYPKARTLIDELLTRPDAAPMEVLAAHVLAGQIERTVGNNVAAREHFLIVLRTDSDWQLVDDAPPKVRTFFELVRQDVIAEQQALALVPATTVVDEAEVDEVRKAPPVAGLVVGGVGTAVVAAGVVTGIVGETMFADAGNAFDDRASGRAMALAGWSGVAIGVVVGVVGIGLLLAE